MAGLPPALHQLIIDPDGKKSDACITTVLNELKQAGIGQKALIKALSRALSRFCFGCAPFGRNFEWTYTRLKEAATALKAHAQTTNRLWAWRFFKNTGALYEKVILDVLSVPHASTPTEEDIAANQLKHADVQGMA